MKSTMRKMLIVLFAAVSLVAETATAGNLQSLKQKLAAVGVKCGETDDGEQLVHHLTFKNGPSFPIFVDRDEFMVQHQFFRMVWGGVTGRPKASDLTEEQLDWILVLNGKLKLGGIRILYESDDASTILVRIPVPDDADGATLKSAMWMCADILKDVDEKFPKAGSSSSKNESDKPARKSKSKPVSPASPVSTASADEIIAKAENHDGIVIGGFYLGMSPEDALVLCEHYFGHMGTVKLNRVVWKHYLDDIESPDHLQVKTFEGIVLVTDDGKYQAICTIGKKEDDDATAVEDMRSAKRVVNGFRFDSKMIRALIGKKKVMSASALGRAFFRKYDLDADIDYFFDEDIEFKTPERESVIFINGWSKVYFGFNLDKDTIKFLGDGFGFDVEHAEKEKWSGMML